MPNSLPQFNLNPPFDGPLCSNNVSAGFPAPASEYIEDPIDLNQYLIPRAARTFFFRMSSEIMKNVGIRNNCILLVDRSMSPVNGKIVIAKYEGGLTVRRFYKNKQVTHLLSENKPSLAVIGTGVKNEPFCRHLKLDWKIFNLFFIFRLAVI